MFRKLISKIQLTRTEIKVVLFLLGTLLLGFGAKFYLKGKDQNKIKEFNYYSEDSLFNSVNFSSPEKNSKNKEKIVDYKQEVLDFKKSSFSYKDKEELPAEKSIDINKAGINELIKLPGIGKKTAGKIINYRKSNGNFAELEEIIKVKGIGQSKFNNIKKYIFINNK